MHILGDKIISWECPNVACESATLSREMSPDFKKIKNAGHSRKCPTHFQEILGTFLRINGDISNTY